MFLVQLQIVTLDHCLVVGDGSAHAFDVLAIRTAIVKTFITQFGCINVGIGQFECVVSRDGESNAFAAARLGVRCHPKQSFGNRSIQNAIAKGVCPVACPRTNTTQI